MPFHTNDTDNEPNITDIIIPSLAPENIFECLEGKGLQFIHLNARSMFHKLPELHYIAKKISYHLNVLKLVRRIIFKSQYKDRRVQINQKEQSHSCRSN